MNDQHKPQTPHSFPPPDPLEMVRDDEIHNLTEHPAPYAIDYVSGSQGDFAFCPTHNRWTEVTEYFYSARPTQTFARLSCDCEVRLPDHLTE